VAGYGPSRSGSLRGALPSSRANPDHCASCVTRTAEIELQVVQRSFDYFYYPFDVQALHIHFRVDGGHIYTCENQSALAPMLPFASETDAEEKLLPLTKEWTLANGLVDSIRLSHPTQNGVPQYHKCELQLIIKRNSVVFLVKSMITSLVVVFGSLATALWMHPEDLIGDRFAVLFIGFLILVTNMQADLGLGAVTQLLWIDYFNLGQMCLILVAVFESTVVHLLLKTQRESFATSIDHVMRICIPFFLYVVVTFSMIIYGCDQIAHCPHRQVCGPGPQTDIFKRRSEITGRLNMAQVAMFVGIVCGIATIVGSTLAIVLKAKRTRRAQIDSVAALVELTTQISQKGSSEQDVSRRASSWADVTAAIFHAFDLDDSGSIDFKEMRQIVTQMYPMAPADLVRPALMSVRPFADAESQIDLPSFQDAMATLMQFMLQKLQEGNRSAAPVLYVDQPRILRRRRPSNPIGVGKSDATAIKTSVSDSGDDQAENVRGLSSLATAVDSLPVGKTAAVASSDDEQPEPYDPSLPSLCILSTRDGGAQLRHVSGMNLPAHLAVGYTKGLASKAVARLLADGFTLKSTSTGSTPSELTFTFVRDVTLGQPSQPSQPASPPVSASMQSQPNSATVHDVSVGQQSQPASQPTQLGSTEAGNEVTSSAAGVAGVGGQAVETYRPLHPSPPVRTAATSVAEETNSSATVKRRSKKKRDSVDERRPVPLAAPSTLAPTDLYFDAPAPPAAQPNEPPRLKDSMPAMSAADFM